MTKHSGSKPATLSYIRQAAQSVDTPMARAFCRALGIEPKDNAQMRHRHHGRRSNRPKMKRADIEHCRRQRHGVTWRDDH